WRIREDRQCIADTFLSGADPGRVVSITPGLGDPHNAGRTTTAIEFESRLKLVYKPRSVSLLHAWGILLPEIAEIGGFGGFTLPVVLDRGAHGWVSWIPPQQNGAANDAVFVRRLGMLT